MALQEVTPVGGQIAAQVADENSAVRSAIDAAVAAHPVLDVGVSSVNASVYDTLQDAYDALPSGGGRIALPGRHYDVGDGLDVICTKALHLHAVGEWTRRNPSGGTDFPDDDPVLFSSTGAESLITIGPNGFANAYGFQFERVAFDMTAATTKHAISGPNINFMRVEGCRFRYAAASPMTEAIALYSYVDLATGNDVSWWRVRDNTVTRGALLWVGLDGVTANNNQHVIAGNVCFGWGESETTAPAAITLHGSHRSVIADNNIEIYALGMWLKRCYAVHESGDGGEQVATFLHLEETYGSYVSPIGESTASGKVLVHFDESYDNVAVLPPITSQASLYGTTATAVTYAGTSSEGSNTILGGRGATVLPDFIMRGRTIGTTPAARFRNTGASALGATNSLVHIQNANASDTGTLLTVKQGGSATLAALAHFDGGIVRLDMTHDKPLRATNGYLWIDSSGVLRIKATAPTSDTDGTVVGSQT